MRCSFTVKQAVLSLGAVLAVGCAGAKADLVDADVAAYTSDASGFDTHSFFYDTGAEVVVFDAQFTEAQAEKVLAAIRAKTGNPQGLGHGSLQYLEARGWAIPASPG